MSDVKRFDGEWRQVFEQDDGDYVLFEDYQKLASRLEAAEKESVRWKEYGQKNRGERNTALIEKHAAESRFDAIRELLKDDEVGEWKELMALVNGTAVETPRDPLCNCGSEEGQRHMDGCNVNSRLVVEKHEHYWRIVPDDPVMRICDGCGRQERLIVTLESE